MKPFTYLIGWSILNVWYYGLRYSYDCEPSDLWTTYFTSSELVKEFREENGEPDIIQVRKVFDCKYKAIGWEHKVLRRIKAATNSKYLNKSNGHNTFFASNQTEKSKRKISKSCKGRIPYNKGKKTGPNSKISQIRTERGIVKPTRPCIVNGVRYESIYFAADATGYNPMTIRKYCYKRDNRKFANLICDWVPGYGKSI